MMMPITKKSAPMLTPKPTQKPKKQSSLVVSEISIMTAEEDFEIFMPSVITTVSRRETISCLLDTYFQAALIKSHPATNKHLPLHVNTIYDPYFLKIGTMAHNDWWSTCLPCLLVISMFHLMDSSPITSRGSSTQLQECSSWCLVYSPILVALNTTPVQKLKML